MPEKYERIVPKTFLKLLGILYLVALIPNVITKLLIFNKVIPSNNIELLLKEYSPLKLFLFGAIVAPIAEETIFRLNLKTSKLNLVISLTVTLMYSLFAMFKNSWHYSSAIILIITYVVVTLIYYSEEIFKIDSQKHFKFTFYFSAIAFGFLHIFNFNDPNYLTFILFPVITMPQIAMGLITGYLRLKNGFVHGVIFHILVNAITILLVLILR
ncbi:MAG: CPBP family intramembrane metalloprotease [Bacteroidetes bacterium]|nr:CPBP family intramembrane metalloprotease [Bacteroidota bacterium]